MKMGKTLRSRREFEGRMISLDVDTVALPDGPSIDLEIVRHPGAAAVVPLDQNDDVILVRQYRHTVSQWLLEIPAGKLDAPDEPPESCARRELEEETGFSAARYDSLGSIWVSPGFTDERIWLYLARELTEGEQRLEDDELIELERMPLERAVAMAADGAIADAKSATALLRAASLLQSSSAVRN
ncbi:MAG: NUDIX hydrolase [Myxococcota bacterium]